MTKIKVLQSTPTCMKGTILTTKEFREHFPTVIHKDNSDYFLVSQLQENNEWASWFEIVEENKFKVGDWVWSEKLKQALQIIEHSTLTPMTPCQCSVEAVRDFTDIYKRLATAEEIDYWSLRSYGNKILVNKRTVYIHNNIWKEVVGVHSNIRTYLEFTLRIGCVSVDGVREESYYVKPFGVKVGCTILTHEEVLSIAQLLGIQAR